LTKDVKVVIRLEMTEKELEETQRVILDGSYDSIQEYNKKLLNACLFKTHEIIEGIRNLCHTHGYEFNLPTEVQHAIPLEGGMVELELI